MFVPRAGRRALALAVITAALASALAMLVASAANATVVTSLPGGTWSILPSTTDGGTATIVTGPSTPPAGTGSLRLTVASAADRALVGSDLGASMARPWAGLSASFSTYVPEGGSEFFAPSLRFAGFQVVTPAPLRFTTLNVEVFRNGTVKPGQWQNWTVGPTTTVWQSNASDGFCVQSAPCTLAEFALQYPAGAWGEAQLGIGSGVAGPATGYVDAVTINDGAKAFFTDFDPKSVKPSPSPSVVPKPKPTGGGKGNVPTLPVTGQSESLWFALAGTALMLFGGGLMLAGRRERRRI
jgi:LPXTG-motif cell wall-anchored protein